MATTTHTRPAAQPVDHAPEGTRLGAAAATLTATLVAVLPVLVALAGLGLAVANPGLAFVLFGLSAAAALAAGVVYGVARLGAAVAERV